jgi:cytochrome P450
LKQRINAHVDDPETLKELPHSTTIFNLLINPEVHKSKKAADAESIYQESQALMFGGGDTTASVIMIGTFYLLKHPELGKRLKGELRDAWPDVNQELSLKELEALPYLVSIFFPMNLTETDTGLRMRSSKNP